MRVYNVFSYIKINKKSFSALIIFASRKNQQISRVWWKFFPTIDTMIESEELSPRFNSSCLQALNTKMQ